jgi:hypothetical protein
MNMIEKGLLLSFIVDSEIDLERIKANKDDVKEILDKFKMFEKKENFTDEQLKMIVKNLHFSLDMLDPEKEKKFMEEIDKEINDLFKECGL